MKSFIEHIINEQELRMDRDLQTILRAHAKDYKAFKDGKEDLLDLPKLYDALMNHWQTDMPYGVMKARSGDPYEWIADRLDTISEKALEHN